MDKVEFAKFPNEFDVAQHLDLCNSTLLLLLRGEWVVIFLKDYRRRKKQSKIKNKETLTRHDTVFCN